MGEKMMKSTPWPSTVNVSNFVTVKPSLADKASSNFRIWKQQMQCLLVSQDLEGFIKGTEEETEAEEQWRRRDNLVKGWILGSLGEDTLEAVWEEKTSYDVWKELRRIFSKVKEEKKDKKENKDGKPEDEPTDKISKDLEYMQVYKAAQRGDSDAAHMFFEDKEESITTANISSNLETALHVAVLTGKANGFVTELVETTLENNLKQCDCNGNTALHIAGMVGNMEAAKALVEKNPDLLYELNNDDRSPALQAAVHCHKEMLHFLLDAMDPTKPYEDDDVDSPLEGQLGIRLLNAIIASGYLDIALKLVHEHPDLALLTDEDDGASALSTIAAADDLFQRTDSFRWSKTFIYYCIPSKKRKFEASPATNRKTRMESPAADIENDVRDSAAHHNDSSLYRGKYLSSIPYFNLRKSLEWQKVESMIWNGIKHLEPKSLKELRHKKATHEEAVQLVDYLCDKIELEFPRKKASDIFERSIIEAAKNGISEIVERIIDKYPPVISHVDPETGENIFHLAAKGRFENVINLIDNMSDRKCLFFDSTDKNDNNLMHICGEMAPPHRLNLVPGAALQMQRELHWFQKMEEIVNSSRRTWPNSAKKTPQMLFTEKHEKLKEDGERWMKDTANACTITAALIATIMFAAAFTVPGGLDSGTGIPLFTGHPAFDVFAVADALSLFTSITSLLMFLSILTSRYAEQDFVRVLPQRLCIGLLCLFVSITFMMVVFSATIYLLFRTDALWFVLMAAFACLPVTSFVLLQFPLLVDVVYSTYGPGIFRKKSGRFLY